MWAAVRRPCLLLTWMFLFAGATPQGAESQVTPPTPGTLTGRVLDGVSRQPLIGAEVGVDGTSLAAITDEDGAFHFPNVRSGAQILWTRRFGYLPRTDSIRVPEGAILEVTVAISREPVELEEIRVVVQSSSLKRNGFYMRQAQGYGGNFIDREQIEIENPVSVTALFRNVPGLRVIWGGIHGSRVFVNQRVTFSDDGMPGCEPGLWLDGVRSTLRTYDLMRAEEIEGIEIYAGGSAPGKFIDICGTVVIWTRDPTRRR